MAKEAIGKIKAAEEEAAAIRQSAAAEIKAMLAAEEEAGAELCRKAEAEAVRETGELIAGANKKAAELIALSAEKAESEAAEQRKAAESRLGDAVNKIVKEVTGQCQQAK